MHLERLQCCLNHARQEDTELVVFCAGKVVVAWVLNETAEEKGPGEVVDSILLGAHRASHNLCIQMISQLQKAELQVKTLPQHTF